MDQALSQLLARYADRVATRHVVVAPDAVGSIPALLAETTGGTREFLIVADSNTWPVAGARVAETLAATGLSTDSLILEPGPSELKIHPDERRVGQVEERLKESRAVALAVGAGTINDIAKMASFHLGRPYAVVAMAPSMNGWTSAIAAVVEGGLKMTVPARGPVLVAADPEILRNAPERMIAAGFADLMAKGVASADWRLADSVIGGGFDPELEEVSKTAIDLLEGQETAIAERKPEAIERLMEGLCISGLSMAIAESSAHISGSEHLFSHYIDMVLLDVAERELHGRQVGIGTLCIASMYEQLLKWPIEQLDIEHRVASQPTWDVRRREIEDHFDKLSPVVLPQAEALHAEGDALRERLNRFTSAWPDLRAEVAAAVAPRTEIERRLRTARAPAHFSEIGLTDSQTREILTRARDIRSRYTILHLAADLGLLGPWINHAMAAFVR